MTAADAYWQWFTNAYNPNVGPYGVGGSGGDGGAASRANAKKQLDLQRKKYEFELKTGLRDIEQGR